MESFWEGDWSDGEYNEGENFVFFGVSVNLVEEFCSSTVDFDFDSYSFGDVEVDSISFGEFFFSFVGYSCFLEDGCYLLL